MSENKRKHSGKDSGPRKRYKSDGSRIASTTIHGPGVFVTCVKGKERLAANEIRDVFEEIATKLWPVEATTGNGVEDLGSDSEDEEEDLEARIMKERSRLQADASSGKVAASGKGASGGQKVRKRIVIHYTDTPCILFVSCAPPLDPIRLSLTYLDEVKESGIARTRCEFRDLAGLQPYGFTRAVQRLEPISNTCVAALPELLLLGEKVMHSAFNPESDGARKFTYKVIAKVRNNSKLTSLQIIEELPRKVPDGHSVSLKSPELVIFVVVFKSVAGIGILPRYEELKRYNVAQLVDARDLDVDQGQESRLKKQPEPVVPDENSKTE